MNRLTIKAPSGLIHLKDNTEMSINEAIKKLADYEDAEEQGLLTTLPCKVGDTVYRPVPKTYRIYTKMTIKEILIDKDGIYFRTDGVSNWKIETIGESIFLTEEEAKQVIQEHMKARN